MMATSPDPGAPASHRCVLERQQRAAIDWTDDISRAVGGFFLIVAVAKIAAPASLIDTYARWGLIDGVRESVGWLELGVAGLLLWKRGRTAGVILGAGISAAAAFMLLLHAEFSPLPGPLVLMVILLAAARRLDRIRGTRSPKIKHMKEYRR